MPPEQRLQSLKSVCQSPILLLSLPLFLAVATAPALAWIDLDRQERTTRPDGIHVLDGTYVMNAGQLHINITNHGIIGSQFSRNASWSHAPSGQWPGGSGNEYLWSAGLWVGARKLGQTLVSTGQFEREFRPRPNLEATIYEAIDAVLLRPPGNIEAGGARIPDPNANDDAQHGDGRIDEEILNGYDEDDDGRIDEDFAQIGTQMMVCTMYDNTALSMEEYPDHEPLDLKVVMSTYAWNSEVADDFVGFRFDITNVGLTDLEDVYFGFFADCDVGSRDIPGAGGDDLAGGWTGLRQARDGTWVDVSVAYMYDAAENNRIEGYFGVLFLGARFDPASSIRGFQSFAPNVAFDDGGEPNNDEERYELLSATGFDTNIPELKKNDFRFLVSAGPWSRLEPNQSRSFEAVMVAGNDLRGLLDNCVEAVLTWRGAFFDLDNNPMTGVGGRETKVCLEWFDEDEQGTNILLTHSADYFDQSCLPFGGLELIPEEDLYVDEFGQHCIWVNMDNCDECAAVNGQVCNAGNFFDIWRCNNMMLPEEFRPGCTGVLGKETNIPWLVGMPPPPPGLRVWPRDNGVHVYWDDRSEHIRDLRLNEIDFESYKVWRADDWTRPLGTSLDNGPGNELWQLIDEFDVINDYTITQLVGDSLAVYELPLGRNTGFESIRYDPACLTDPRFDGLAEAMQDFVDSDPLGFHSVRPPLRDANGRLIEGRQDLQPWEHSPAVLDTFFMAAVREQDLAAGIRSKRGSRFYEYIDREVHNGFLYFYSVTATDHEMDDGPFSIRTIGPGLTGSPTSSFTSTTPGTAAQSAEDRIRLGANIYVYPNPATREALAEFQELYPNADDPTGVRVMFTNLPAARNTIRIFTTSGDLVQTLRHDGSDGYGMTSWNLVSRNGQQVVSGLYLYSVETAEEGFDDFIGKFVIIR